MDYILSRWNSYIGLGVKSGLIYNASADSFVVVKEASDDFVNAREGKIDLFSETFREQLIESGALVPEDMDETGELERLIGKIDGDDSCFQLIINPTLDCNFHCWYCYENHIKDSVMSPDLVNGVENMVARRLSEQSNMRFLHLSFFGGEPLLRYDEVVLPIVYAVHDLCSKKGVVMTLHFTTNSFLLTDEMIRTLSDYQASFQITLDGGREYHDNTRFGAGKKPSFDVILDNIRKLALSDMKVTLRVNFTGKNLESTREIIEILGSFPPECRKNIKVDYQRVWQDSESRDNQEIIGKVRGFRKRLRELGYPASNSRTLNMVRDSCYGDKTNELVVNFNGDIYACTARDFRSCDRLGLLSATGDIEWNEAALNKRRSCRFSKPVCRRCRIAPICGGGCRTKCMEQSHHDGCNLGYDDEKIDSLILERFEERFMSGCE